MSLSTADTTTSTTLSPRSSNVERLSRKQRVGSSSLPVGSIQVLTRGREAVSRQAHNLEIGGSNPPCATTFHKHPASKAKGTVDRQFMPAAPFAINPERQDQRSL